MKLIVKIGLVILIALVGMTLWSHFGSAVFPFVSNTHYYNFDETSGDLIDQRGTSDGTLIENAGGAGYTIARGAGVTGILNTAYNFSAISTGGAGTYVNITTPTTACDDLICSWSLWHNTTQSGARIIFYLGDSSNTATNRNYTQLYTDTGGVYGFSFSNKTNSATSMLSSGGHNNARWQHIAIVMNQTTAVMYVNGTLEKSVLLNSTALGYNTNQLRQYIGGRANLAGDVADMIQGQIDELGIWDKALTASEVSDLYNSGAGEPFTASNVILNSPVNNSYTPVHNSTFNITAQPFNAGSNLVNITLWVWNGTTIVNNTVNKSLTGTGANTTTMDITNLPFGQGLSWNAYVCELDGLLTTLCNYAANNFTLNTYNISEYYTDPLTEGISTGINMNITFTGIDTDVLALLNWNGVNSSATKSIIDSDTVKFSSTFVVPVGTGSVAGTSVDHFWRFWLPDGTVNQTTTTASQTVYSLGIDNCTTFSNLLYNFTMYDEDTKAYITPSAATNTSMQVGISLISQDDTSQITYFNKTYTNENPAHVCVGTGILNSSKYTVTAQVQYTAQDYVIEFYNTQNVLTDIGTFPQLIPLYPLLTTRSQEFLVTYKDSSFLPVSNAVIRVNRKYIGDGLFRTVEAPLTDSNGQAITHLILGDEIYDIYVYKDNVLQAYFPNKVAFCSDLTTGDCRISLNALSGGTAITDFSNRFNLTYSLDFDKTTRTISTTFSQDDGTNHLFNLTGTLFDALGNNTGCSQSTTTSSGFLTCVIPEAFGNYTIEARFYRDNQLIDYGLFSLKEDANEITGQTGIILLLLLFITIPLMLITTGVGVVIGGIIGLILASLLTLFNGTIIGIGSSIMWFIIAGIILIFKIRARREG